MCSSGTLLFSSCDALAWIQSFAYEANASPLSLQLQVSTVKISASVSVAAPASKQEFRVFDGHSHGRSQRLHGAAQTAICKLMSKVSAQTLRTIMAVVEGIQDKIASPKSLCGWCLCPKVRGRLDSLSSHFIPGAVSGLLYALICCVTRDWPVSGLSVAQLLNIKKLKQNQDFTGPLKNCFCNARAWSQGLIPVTQGWCHLGASL